MANITKTSKLGKQLLNGIVISATQLRKEILNPREVHTFVMLEDQIDELLNLLVSDRPDTDLGITSSKRQGLINELIGGNETLENAEIIGQDRVFASFKQYITLLNKADPTNPRKYELGHEQGVATKVITLLEEMSRQGSSSIFTPEYKTYIRKAIKAAVIIDQIDEKALADINRWISTRDDKTPLGGGTMVDLETVLQAAGSTMDASLSISKTSSESINGSKMTIVLRPELSSINQFTGRLAGNLLDSLRNVQKRKSTKDLDRILAHTDIFNLEGSASVNQIISSKADKAIGIHKKSTKKVTSKFKTKIRPHRKIPANNQRVKRLKKRVATKLATLKIKIEAVKKKKKFIIPTVTFKAILNQSLAEFIRARMEDSKALASRNYLRNQTGRFSESAVILTMTRKETGAYFGTYTYQRNPYQVFEAGEELGSPGRDPRLYIEGAAREIAQAVLKRQFNGLNLEAK